MQDNFEGINQARQKARDIRQQKAESRRLEEAQSKEMKAKEHMKPLEDADIIGSDFIKLQASLVELKEYSSSFNELLGLMSI